MSTELLPNLKYKPTDANGLPVPGGKIWTYEAGTSTPLATYTDQAATTPHPNPIILDGSGEATIYITSGVQYKAVFTDPNDVVIWTEDNWSGVGFSGNLGTGDAVGPASSVNNQIALFSGTTGKVIKAAIGSGFVKATLGVISYVTGIDLSTDTTGTLPTNRGGTGATSASDALNALLPAQTGNANKFLQSDGTNAGWNSVQEVPDGGTAGQLLSKIDGADGNAEWVDAPTSLPVGGTTGQVLTKLSGTDGDADWEDAATSLPSQSGNSGKFLTTNGTAASWQTINEAFTVMGSRATPNDVAYNIGFNFGSGTMGNLAFVQGDGGPTDVTADPQIGPGVNVGQRLVMILVDASKSITWNDGNGLKTLGGPVVMDVVDQPVEWIWDGDDWIYLG